MPDAGRFVNQDSIGLWGGTNFYQFAMNALGWVDPLGLARKPISSRLPEGSRTGQFWPKMEKFNLKFGKCAQVFPGLSSLTTRFISGVSLLLLPNSISQCQDLDFSMKNPDKCGAKKK